MLPEKEVDNFLFIRGQPIASHIAFGHGYSGLSVLRGTGLKTHELLPDAPIPDLMQGFVTHVYGDEEIHPQVLVGSTKVALGSEIQLYNVNTQKTSGSLILGVNQDIVSLQSNAALLSSSTADSATSLIELDLNCISKMTITGKRFDEQSSFPGASYAIKYQRHGRADPWRRTPSTFLMLPLTERVKLLTLVSLDSVAVTDFRDSKPGASSWLTRHDNTDQQCGYMCGAKAASRAYLFSDDGKMICIDRGVIADRTVAWPVPHIFGSTIYCCYPFSAHSPMLSLRTASESFVFDVKRQQVTANIGAQWSCALPLYSAGMPHLFGINETTSRLEVVK